MSTPAPRSGRSTPRLRVDPSTLALGAVILGAAVPLVVVAALGLSNRFQADDFYIAVSQRRFGFFGSVGHSLHHLNGRFAGFLITNVLSWVGPSRAVVVTWLTLLLLLAALWAVVPPQPWQNVVRRAAIAVALAAGIVGATPMPDQTFLWISGIGMLTASVVFAIAAVAAGRCATEACGRRRIAWLCAAGVAGVLASGSYEMTGVLLLVLCAGAFLAVALAAAVAAVDRSKLLTVVVVAGGVAAGLLVVATMPGASHRKELFNGLPMAKSIELGLRHAQTFLAGRVETAGLSLAFVAGLFARAPRLSAIRAAGMAAVGIVTTFAAISAGFAFSIWSLGGPPPGRTLTPFVVSVAALLFFLGWLVPTPSRIEIVPAVFAVVVAVSSAGPLYDRIGPRRAWAASWDERHATLRAHAYEDIVVHVPIVPTPEGLEDLSGDPAHWVNSLVAGYYEVDGVVGVPAPPPS